MKKAVLIIMLFAWYPVQWALAEDFPVDQDEAQLSQPEQEPSSLEQLEQEQLQPAQTQQDQTLEDQTLEDQTPGEEHSRGLSKTEKLMWDALKPKTGVVQLPNGVATLNVPEEFYYLNPKDSEKVLVQAWGNPPDPDEQLLGMIFPDGLTPFEDGTWGVTINYEEQGYVSDKDADSIDYDELMLLMQKDTRRDSLRRVKSGYDSVELVGWASKPYYDSAAHKLHWAQEIKFGKQSVNTLNYNIRVLGRKGVLVLNFIAGMDQKKLIDSKLNAVLAMADFKRGARYEDFDPSVDKVAAYGIGALVAGKVLAKTGVLASLLLIFKKLWIVVLVGIGAFFGKIFSRR